MEVEMVDDSVKKTRTFLNDMANNEVLDVKVDRFVNMIP